jgi:hypothetical protein
VKKLEKKARYAERAQKALAAWWGQPLAPLPVKAAPTTTAPEAEVRP